VDIILLQACYDNCVGATSQGVSMQRDLACPTTTLNVTLLGDEWASLTGGLSTFNRELAINLADQPNVEVTFFVPEGFCTDEHKKTAKKCSVKIVEAKELPGYDPHNWLIVPHPNLRMDVVIGHGIKLGRQAQVLRGHPSDNLKWVQVLHTAPEELGMFKNQSNAVSKAGLKHEIEVELCKRADLVVPVGPKLAEAYSSCLRSKEDEDMFVITPGLFKEFEDLKQDRNDSSDFKVLLCGRGDSEDFELKGYDIGAEAFADEELKGKPYRLLSVGAPDGKEDEVATKLLKHGVAKEQLIVRKFVQSRDKMKELFREVDLAIMPSRTEGFGLIALEALSASLPILVSSNSGFARALRNLQSGTSCIVNSKEPKDWAKAIKAVRERHGEELQEIRKLRECYGKKYGWEKQCKDLVERMRNMFREINLSGTCSPDWFLK